MNSPKIHGGVYSYNRKLVISGNVVELYEYDIEQLRGFEKKNHVGRGGGDEITQEDKDLNRERVLLRAKRDLRRLINANVGVYREKPKFLTLTFKKNITDTTEANYEWKKFRQRLEYRIKKKLKYIVVVEFQKRGAVHYHAVLFNMPYIHFSEYNKIWNNGFLQIDGLEDIEDKDLSEVDNIGAYVSKYMTKASAERLEGKKSYFTARGMVKPVEVTDEYEINRILADFEGNEVYSNVFKLNQGSKTVGIDSEVRYKQFNSWRSEKLSMSTLEKELKKIPF